MKRLWLATLLLATSCGDGPPSVSHADFEKIKLGATYSDVAALIGFEGRKVSGQDHIIGSIAVPDEGLSPGEDVFIWMNKDGSNVSVKFYQRRAIQAAEWDLCTRRKLCFK